MEVVHSSYLISSPTVESCPKPDRPEYAFIGRSNVGKSSLINMLTNKKELAKVSRSPGKTQLINHFTVVSTDKKQWYLVDLPGYGFAKRSMTQRKAWEKMIQDYLRKRENLGNIFVLVDSRLEPQKIDIDFINKLGEWRVPFAVVFTKSDKTTQRETAAHAKQLADIMRKTWEYLPPFFITSSEKHTGGKKILEYIMQLNEDFYAQTNN